MRCRCRPPPRTPALISGSANRARSDAMITSQHATSAKPAPTAAPLMAPITGSGQSLSAQKQSRTMLPGSSRSTMLSPSPSSRPCRRAESCRSTPPQNTRSPGAVKIATCASVPCRSSVNALLDLAEGLRVECVHRRTVEGHGRDPVLDLDGHVLHRRTVHQPRSELRMVTAATAVGPPMFWASATRAPSTWLRRFAAQLVEELDALRDAGGTGRVALRLQAPARVDRQPPADAWSRPTRRALPPPKRSQNPRSS